MFGDKASTGTEDTGSKDPGLMGHVYIYTHTNVSSLGGGFGKTFKSLSRDGCPGTALFPGSIMKMDSHTFAQSFLSLLGMPLCAETNSRDKSDSVVFWRLACV